MKLSKANKKKKSAPKATVAAGKPAKDGRTERTRYEKSLLCTIDEKTRDRSADELGKIIREREEFLERRKAQNAKAREQRAHFDERIKELGEQIEKRAERRMVEVVDYLVIKDGDKWVETVRCDTEEIVEKRDAGPDDLQDALF